MGKGAKTRRADRKEARQTKKADIQSGESRKEAREAKHSTKSADRAEWKQEGVSIGQSIESDSSSVGDAIADGGKEVLKEVSENPEDFV